MKRALIENATNRVVQVVTPEEEFEVHSGLYWVDCPDNVETYWLLNDDNTFTDPHENMRDEFGNLVEPWIMQRMRAYAPAGDQLDMMFRELRDTGTISKDGAWYKHILDAKAATPKPPQV